MSADLPKTYDPSSVESQAIDAWTSEKLFHAEPTDPGDPYCIVIPPPNVTAALHLGHALNNTLQDILARQHRMMGDNTAWIPGTDHAGIATQTVVEKRVFAEEGKRRTEFTRDAFVQKIQAWKDEYEQRITEQLKRMGCSCDWDRQAFTMDEPRAKAVREAFFQLFKDGLIYRGKRLVNWDPVTQTALADDEVENEEIDGHFYYLRYPLSGAREPSGSAADPEYVTVATTRPETMLGDTAVAINPKDPRAAQLRGKKILLPIVNREIPIIEDDYVVLPVSLGGDEKDAKAQFATGFLKVTPAHDPNDYEIGRRHNLATINVMAPDASISDKFGWTDIGDASFILGKSREEARKLVVDWFKQNGLLEEVKPYKHSVGHSYRSHVPIEPYLSDQWYCRVTDDRLRGAALRAMARDQLSSPSPLAGEGRGEGSAATTGGGESQSKATPHPNPLPQGEREEEGKLRFYPARYAKTFQTWHENLRDWCISRQLWWGHRIPVWQFTKHDAIDSKNDAQIQSLIEQLIRLRKDGRIALQHAESDNPLAPTDLQHSFICVREADDTPALVLLEELGFTQDPDVLDTWFSSALWPMSTLGWPVTAEAGTPRSDSVLSPQSSALDVWNPTSVLCTAREIITLWVSRMVMFNLYFLDRLPFTDVCIHPMIQDGHGQKMSKSLGNGVDPLDIISTHGADAMRFTLALMATNTQDVRMPVDMVDPHTGETFAPKYITDAAGHTVAAPMQESPKNPSKKMTSSYGVASGKAKPTPDAPAARNTSSKFDLGRNFCNKLWNAARFAMMNLSPSPLAGEGRGEGAAATEGGAVPQSKAPPHPNPLPQGERGPELSLADRWILSRFNRTVAESNAALKEYRFDVYGKACYDFFWRDFCDWYLEAIKPAMRDANRREETATVLAAVLDGALRLMHPLIPFITEIVWWRLNDVRPARGLPGILESKPSPRLIKASWPDEQPPSDDAEASFAKMREIIGAIRNARNDYKVDVKKPVTVSIDAPAEVAALINENRQVIELLSSCRITGAAPGLAAPAGATRLPAAGASIYVENLIDTQAEQQRNTKRRDELTKSIAAMKGRLSNEAYIAKAPPHLVQQTRDQLAAAEEELAKLV